jgi:hypothetical protein
MIEPFNWLYPVKDSIIKVGFFLGCSSLARVARKVFSYTRTAEGQIGDPLLEGMTGDPRGGTK